MKTVLTAIILLISINVSAQFDITSGQDTEKTITIESKEYKIFDVLNIQVDTLGRFTIPGLYVSENQEEVYLKIDAKVDSIRRRF